MKQPTSMLDRTEKELVKKLHKKYAKLRKFRHKAKRAIDPSKVKPLPIFDGCKSWKAFTREK